MSFSRTKCTTHFFPLSYLKKDKNFSKFPFLHLLSLSSCSTAFKVCPPLCSGKPALHDLILNIASGFSSFQIWNSLTFYCGSLALCLFLFHWKPNSQMQQIHRHTLFCYCLKDQLQLVLSCKFHIRIFQPSKPILLKCLDSICFESSLEGAWCSCRKSFKHTYIFHCIKLILQRVVVAANHNSGFTVKFYYTWDLGLGSGKQRHPGCKHEIFIHKDHVMKVNMAFFPPQTVLTASILREGFRCYHCTNLNKWWRDCLWFENVSTKRREGCRPSKGGSNKWVLRINFSSMIGAVFQMRHSLPKLPKWNLNLFSSQDYSSFPTGFFLGCKIATHADLVFKWYHSYVKN